MDPYPFCLPGSGDRPHMPENMGLPLFPVRDGDVFFES